MTLKSIYLMEKEEVELQDLMAYTLAKLGSFEWYRTSMYTPSNIYDAPAGFYFRFHGNNEIYKFLGDCIESYHGKLNWCIHPSHNTRHKNYIIEPIMVYEVKLKKEYLENYNLREILRESYESLCEQAISDVPLLCKHIEDWFQLDKKRPYLPTLPQ